MYNHLTRISDMEYLLFPLAVILSILGVAGCIIPVLPGPPIAFVGVLIVYFTTAEVPGSAIVIYGIITLVTVILDYIVPMLGVKYFGGTRSGKLGCFIGSLAGLFFMPWGIIAGPFFGALIGEIIGESNMRDALMSGLGSLLGFLVGVTLKIVVCLYFAWVTMSSIVSYLLLIGIAGCCRL